MKQIKASILLAALALLAACQQEIMETAGGADNAVVQIAPSVGSLLTRSNPMGDTDAQKQFNVGDQIAVSANTQPEVIYTLDAKGTWTPQEGKQLLWESDAMTFKVYYPVEHEYLNHSNNASFTDFTVPKFQDGLDNDDANHIHWADRMTYEGNVERSGTSASFPMARQMARVIFNITKVGNEIDAGATFKYQVHSKDALPLSSSSNTIQISGYVEEGSTTSKPYDTITALVIPSEKNDAGYFLTVTVTPDPNNRDNHYDLHITGKPLHEAGKSYTYNVTVGKDKLEVTSVTVAGWTSGENITGGEATENKLTSLNR